MTPVEAALLESYGKLVARVEKLEDQARELAAEVHRAHERIDQLRAERRHDDLSRSRGAPVRPW